MYREWNKIEDREWSRAIVSTQAFPAMFERHTDMVGGYDDETLKKKIEGTADLMEAYAVLAFSRAAQRAARRRAGPGSEDQPLRRVARPRSLGGRRPVRRHGDVADRGAGDAGGGSGVALHGGDRAAGVSRRLARCRASGADRRADYRPVGQHRQPAGEVLPRERSPAKYLPVVPMTEARHRAGLRRSQRRSGRDFGAGPSARPPGPGANVGHASGAVWPAPGRP